MIDKTVRSVAEALAGIKDGSTVLIAGFAPGGGEYSLEHWLPGDVALVEAWRADRWGNLVYRDAGRNFNPVMAAAAQLTIAQTQHVAELGELSPEEIATPGIYVDRVVHVAAGDPPLKT